MRLTNFLFNSKTVGATNQLSKGLENLLKANYVEQVGSGLFSYLNFGLRTIKKIESIIRDELYKIGAQEILLNALQPRGLWDKSGRYETYNPALFKLKDLHDKDLVLAPTHEELITEIIAKKNLSYKSLPMSLFQIQTKFRNELRAKTGILRLREFIMKDLYSFHSSYDDLERFYEKVIDTYHRIFARCGLARTIKALAPTGSIGGLFSHEFHIEAEIGEDTVKLCRRCNYAVNAEYTKIGKNCDKCGQNFEVKKAIELGHTFKLGDLYSKKCQSYFVDRNGLKKPYIMGCYGIGVSRILGALAEIYHDNRGLTMPLAVAPYEAYLTYTEDQYKQTTDEIYKKLMQNNIDVLYDDRSNVSIGEKFYDADLIGLPYRLIISKKTGKKIELKLRTDKLPEGIYVFGELLKILKRHQAN